ncbi:hypothetical protein PRIPAC_88061 [Pristionchus pacificus]|uniref:Uncharacterized protein n=1 Tax=Pristionchus pacificus TaxID=54126 RepID=A0A2A6CYK7_PRIPA|nr:hypothetical protein PRIPAC_88061 [Pristionchus pacificus]|eukprot:PDM83255.1 hypothetical protein PRIPAC_34887 [Pristionchus pacificus]
MLFLPLFLLFLPFLIDGRPFEICHKDACLQYSAICDEGKGVWTAKTKNEKMDDSRCTLSEDDFKHSTNGKSGEDYFHLTIDVLSPTQWTLSIFTYSSIQSSFYIKSPRIDLRENKTEKGWDLTIDGEIYRKTFILIERESNIMECTIEFNETTPLLDLFSDAQFAITINNTNATYDDQQFLTLVAERGPISCTRRDTKPAFLVILIAYAVFATIVAILLLVMIYCIAREAKYKRVSTSESIPRKLERKEKERNGKKKSESERNLPDIDPTTQGTTRDSTVTKEAQISATDISRLKTESKADKKTPS